MKTFYLFLICLWGAGPVFSGGLKPETSYQAIGEYKAFSKEEKPDSTNHVIWKLYVYRSVPLNENLDAAEEDIIAGLTPFPQNGYIVGLRINQLYDFLRPMPKRGDVIVVSGRADHSRRQLIAFPQKDVFPEIVPLDLDAADVIETEHFDPSVIPTVTQFSDSSIGH